MSPAEKNRRGNAAFFFSARGETPALRADLPIAVLLFAPDCGFEGMARRAGRSRRPESAPCARRGGVLPARLDCAAVPAAA